MGAEILALFCVVLAAALADLLICGEEGSGTRQVFHFLTALVVLALLLRPFLFMLGGAEDFFEGEFSFGDTEVSKEDFEKQWEEAVASRSAVELEKGLKELLNTEYGIAAEDCEVAVTLADTGELSRIDVFLSGVALTKDPEVIEKALQKQFECQVEVR